MTVCNLSTPCPGLGDTGDRRRRQSLLRFARGEVGVSLLRHWRERRLPGGAENPGAKSSISMPCGKFSGRPSAPAVPAPLRAWRRRGVALAAARRARRLAGDAENPSAKSSISMPCGKFSGRAAARAVPAPLCAGRRRGLALAAVRRERRLPGGAENPGAKSSISMPCGRFSGRSGDASRAGVASVARASASTPSSPSPVGTSDREARGGAARRATIPSRSRGRASR